jgi:hypothetical protein
MLAAPRSATALDRAVGQWLSGLRRPGALAGQPERAAEPAQIDPDWDPAWPPEWQRHYAGVHECLQELGAELVDLEPGVTIHGRHGSGPLETRRDPRTCRPGGVSEREFHPSLGGSSYGS